ncbi:TadE/TadG family type IV pilus assembly protein [Streptomyces sp. LHD-70]|uniref:TadE/TadG family type IV pilus assembly protein n=1 Tax=Streptomyces sp. LHD-70 TaxID=3072140 RepID=UPI00280F29A3|nr:TadE/TadG family type IV pilus assembly protein [Streptomyces sp. LHD-70]MDQ8707521.1 TadE/TadG family type IV pilus assembly protein [Streptomyces sp. LHD-70]
MSSRTRALRGDAGGVSLSTAIFTPLFLILLGVLVLSGRVALAQGAADAAARDAARTASLAADPISGEAEAQKAAEASLTRSGIRCTSITVAVDTSGLSAPVGEAATVTASVGCEAPFSDLAVPGVPGSKILSSTKTSTVDAWATRERS